ncbi:ABC transporter ATP-binding protein [Conexibacter sp. S30A1]|uniref:branched-chain amino acid ABC transporter ATP-binding protein n=1 Tax=Conexibacter sp. S30A1 TaxID=2937800 RepID=UPI0020107B35|nr:ABC transporter ATP-binding protein [Conexibacter sp. S30A1]
MSARASNGGLSLKVRAAGYDSRSVLEDVEIQARPSEVVSILGHNGAGKTTILRALYGLLPRFSGEVQLADRIIRAPNPAVMLGAGVAYVPTPPNVFGDITVRENLLLGMARHPRGERAERLEAVCELFPALRDRMRAKCSNLSGGQRQMVAISRALLSDPSVLLLDEPSIGLAPVLVEEMMDHIRAFVSRGISVMLVEQSIGVALDMSDYIYVIKEGSVCLERPSSEFPSDEELWTYF